MTEISKQIGGYLLQNHLTLTVAESCTGGLVSKIITDIPGSSAWFDRGFVTYSNNAKIEMLRVSPKTLEKYGAVSEETVGEMAMGAMFNSHADLSIAISGIAGPDGGSPSKPVGLVHFAWCSKRFGCIAKSQQFSGDRDEIRQSAAEYALSTLLEHLQS